MKLAHITPLNCIDIADKYNDMHLLLYHWALKSKRYVDFMRKSKVYKMLDNSFYELRTEIDYDDLIRYASEMKVHEIIAPDVMYDYRKTKKLIDEFAPKVPKGIKIQGVVCGSDIEELESCFRWLNNNESIDVIGISKHGYMLKGVDFCESRKLLTRHILKDNDYVHRPIHMLGINDVSDIGVGAAFNIRSIDGKFLAKVVNNNNKIDLYTKLNRDGMKAAFATFRSLTWS